MHGQVYGLGYLCPSRLDHNRVVVVWDVGNYEDELIFANGAGRQPAIKICAGVVPKAMLRPGMLVAPAATTPGRLAGVTGPEPTPYTVNLSPGAAFRPR